MTADSYIQVRIDATPDRHMVLVALLDRIGYYAFEEQETALLAYSLPADYDPEALQNTLRGTFPEDTPTFALETIAAKDWNAEWEKNFEAVRVDDFCEIRPPFRPSSGATRYGIVVMPKMAFGTGHHSTTWLMVQRCGQIEVAGKKVLDMGCGTGVLGILARQLGAAEVTLIDIDQWSTENTAENAALNDVKGLEIIQGDAAAIPAESCYDIILANINRNVLEADRDHFLRHLRRGGELILSGIYDFDEERLTQHYLQAGLELIDRADRNEWVRLAFRASSNSGKELCL